MIDFKVYNCICGFSAWAMDNVEKVICRECGREVKTEIQRKNSKDKIPKNIKNA